MEQEIFAALIVTLGIDSKTRKRKERERKGKRHDRHHTGQAILTEYIIGLKVSPHSTRFTKAYKLLDS